MPHSDLQNLPGISDFNPEVELKKKLFSLLKKPQKLEIFYIEISIFDLHKS